jgi:L-ascorbate metabolism protein UlaG (beta-lactamase superfamily)
LVELFDKRAARLAFLGHAFMAAPHPIVMCVGSFVAGAGWLSLGTKLKCLVGLLLMVFGSLLVVSMSGLLSLPSSEALQSHVTSDLMLLAVLMLMLGALLYGLLSIALLDLGKRLKEALFRISVVFLAIAALTMFSLGLLAFLALAWSYVPNPLGLHEVLAFFEYSTFLLVVSNSLGNILASAGFVRRARLISVVSEKDVQVTPVSVKVKWLGHAAFQLTFKGKRLLIDPWISNPLSPLKLENLEKVDYVIVTHDHLDHLGEAEQIAKKFNSTVIGVPELVMPLESKGLNVLGMNMGSLVDVEGSFKIALVPALHTCGAGQPVGVVLEVDSLRLYHMGDTGYTSEFQAVKEVFNPDVVFVPIGGHYTMGPKEAALAVKVLRPKIAIPMHYATLPVLVKTADGFVDAVKSLAPEVKVLVLKPGEEIEL